MNNVVLMGRLTRDPFISRKGTPVARFTLACERRINPEVAKQNGTETADFVPCIAFEKNVDFVEKFMRKGGKFAVTGSVNTGKYNDASGNPVYTVDILAKTIEFAGGISTSNVEKSDEATESRNITDEKNEVKNDTDDNTSDFLDIDDDDMPVE